MRGRKQRSSPWPFSPIPLPLLSPNRLVTDTKPQPRTGIRKAVFAVLNPFFSLNNASDAMTQYKQSHLTQRDPPGQSAEGTGPQQTAVLLGLNGEQLGTQQKGVCERPEGEGLISPGNSAGGQ